MNPMHEFIHHDDSHVEDAFYRFKKAHNKNYRDKADHEKRKHNFRHNLRFAAVHCHSSLLSFHICFVILYF